MTTAPVARSADSIVGPAGPSTVTVLDSRHVERPVGRRWRHRKRNGHGSAYRRHASLVAARLADFTPGSLSDLGRKVAGAVGAQTLFARSWRLPPGNSMTRRSLGGQTTAPLASIVRRLLTTGDRP